MKRLSLFLITIILLSLTLQSCSSRHSKPKPPCKGGYWGSGNMNHRI